VHIIGHCYCFLSTVGLVRKLWYLAWGIVLTCTVIEYEVYCLHNLLVLLINFSKSVDKFYSFSLYHVVLHLRNKTTHVSFSLVYYTLTYSALICSVLSIYAMTFMRRYDSVPICITLYGIVDATYTCNTSLLSITSMVWYGWVYTPCCDVIWLWLLC
jgi:hypothetical protein